MPKLSDWDLLKHNSRQLQHDLSAIADSSPNYSSYFDSNVNPHRLSL